MYILMHNSTCMLYMEEKINPGANQGMGSTCKFPPPFYYGRIQYSVATKR